MRRTWISLLGAASLACGPARLPTSEGEDVGAETGGADASSGCVDEPVSIPTDDVRFSQQLIDLDNDGHLDLVANSYADLVVVWWGDGQGDFTHAAYSLLPLDDFATILVGDVDGDQRRDLVVAQRDEWGTGALMVTVARQTEPRAFSSPESTDLVESNTEAASTLALLDVDEDGRDDLAVIYEDSQVDASELQLLISDGTGKFAPPVVASFDSLCATEHMQVADFDGSAPAELLVTVRGDCFDDDLPRTRILTLEPSGAIAGVTELPGVSSAPVLGDLDADGAIDLAFHTGEASQVLFGLGDGSFTPGSSFPELRVGLIAQVDGLGGVDIIGTVPGEDGGYRAVTLYDPLGMPALVPIPALPTEFIFDQQSGDVDEDGCLDLLYPYARDGNSSDWYLRRCYRGCGSADPLPWPP